MNRKRWIIFIPNAFKNREGGGQRNHHYTFSSRFLTLYDARIIRIQLLNVKAAFNNKAVVGDILDSHCWCCWMVRSSSTLTSTSRLHHPVWMAIKTIHCWIIMMLTHLQLAHIDKDKMQNQLRNAHHYISIDILVFALFAFCH